MMKRLCQGYATKPHPCHILTSLLDIRRAQPIGFILVALLLLPFSASPAAAQNFAPVAACGLPDGAGTIVVIEGGAYELTADCTQVKALVTQAATTDVIIRGNGHTIFVATDDIFMQVAFGAGNLIMENVTLDNQGGGKADVPMIPVTAPNTLTLTNVTFQNHQGNGGVYLTNADGFASATTTSTLTNVTFRGFRNPDDPNFPSFVRSTPLFATGQHIVANVNNCRFIDNETRARAPLYAWNNSIINVNNCSFRDSRAAAHIMARGGGVVNMEGCIRFSGTGTDNDFTDRRFDIVDTATGTINDNRFCPIAETPSDEVSSESSGRRPSITPTPKPQVATCPLLPAHIEVFNASESTQCQQVDAAGVGNADVLAAGFRDAVDIWGWVPPDVRVCFRVAGGSFKFLDAATAPRAVSDTPAHGYLGMTCATINRPGTVVLLPGPPVPAPVTAPSAMPTANPSQALQNCMVRANYMLNLRDAPAGAGDRRGGVSMRR